MSRKSALADPTPGDRFGRLVVRCKSDLKDNFYHAIFISDCDCGGTSNATKWDLIKGKSRSCGCFRREAASLANRKREPLESAAHSFVEQYKRGARRRGIEFNMSPEELVSIARGNCYYCGAPPKEKALKSKKLTGLFVGGVDRVDSNKGYTVQNCVPCCVDCNVAKGSLSQDEFASLVSKQYNYFVRRFVSDTVSS